MNPRTINETERLRASLESIPDGILTVDTQKRILHLNPAAITMLGTTYEKALGLPLESVLHTEEISKAQADHLALNQIVIKSANGQRHTVGFRTAPLRSQSGTLIGNILVLSDVSRVSTFSHDAKNALTTLIGSLDTMIGDPAMDGETRKEFLNMARSSSEKLLTRINDLSEAAPTSS